MPDSKPANDVADYADAVRAALASIPEDERAVLVEDLESHLAEVAAESDSPLRERLGEPRAYAAELRMAYGSPVDDGKPRRGSRFEMPRSLVRRITATSTYRELRVIAPELRPGWWVLRAYLAVLIVAFIFRGGQNLRPIPNPFSSHGLLQIVATAVAVVISVRVGRRGAPSRQAWRVAAAAANLAVAALALPVLVDMGTGESYAYLGSDNVPQYLSPVDASYLGPGVTNIYPYSADGKPLKGVLLYDQGGHPLTVIDNGNGGIVTNVPVGADGLPITNSYPLDQRDVNGSPVLSPRVALPPQASPTPRVSPVPAPTP